jgi:glucose/arabinose dehydrogenase
MTMTEKESLTADILASVRALKRTSLPVLVCAALLAACGGGDDATGFPAADPLPTTAVTSPAATARALRLVPVANFTAPVYVTGVPGDTSRLFVVEQAGRIRIVKAGKTLATPFLDIRNLVTSGGEQGLLSVAFPPDYQSSKRFYVYYTGKDQYENVVEYRRATADRAASGSARQVLKMADTEANHNGGSLVFGPDKLMYIGTGDGGGADDQHGTRGNAQDLGSLLGKILRINPVARGGRPYSVPSSNPFAGRAGARGEIYSYGLRNPWRFSFDRKTADLTIGDVGQDDVEEIDFESKKDPSHPAGKGVNFGWRPFEGTRRNFPDESVPGAVGPVIEHTHDAGWCSITGGYVVRDKALPALLGRYVYGDFCQGRLRSARLSAGKAAGDKQLALKQVEGLSSFGEDTRGRVYVVSLNGPVYRLAQ